LFATRVQRIIEDGHFLNTPADWRIITFVETSHWRPILRRSMGRVCMLIRPRWRRVALSRFAKTLALVLAIWTLVDVFTVRRNLAREAAKEVPPFRNDEKIFVASIHWTDEAVLRSNWAPAVAELARTIGPENVFVSIYESGSFDQTKEVLQLLDEDLEQSKIPRKIILDETTHKDEVEKPPAETGWLRMPKTMEYRQNWTGWFTLEKGTWVPRRIPYLADLRNRVMEPLQEMRREEGKVFERVLWLNDVVFTVSHPSLPSHRIWDPLKLTGFTDTRRPTPPLHPRRRLRRRLRPRLQEPAPLLRHVRSAR
jgi:hypothetical protein